MANAFKDIAALAAENLDRPVSADVRAIAAHVRGKFKMAAAVLAYGSCLRGDSADDTLIDLYVLTESERDISASAVSRLGAKLVPPNVYYAEMTEAGRILRCKYAVMTLSSFAQRMTPQTDNPYFWARFSQPAALVYVADANARAAVIRAVTDAAITMYRAALAAAPAEAPPLDIWRRGFEETYKTELRPEAVRRAQEIVEANKAFYGEAARLIGRPDVPRVSWPRRRLAGKALSIVRLAKAAFTFEGGASYAAWKIERHSGRKIELSPWQKRHPVLAGVLLLPRLLWRGAIK